MSRRRRRERRSNDERIVIPQRAEELTAAWFTEVVERALRRPDGPVFAGIVGGVGTLPERAGPDLAGLISGTVFEDANNNGVQDGGEPGIPGVTVKLGAR